MKKILFIIMVVTLFFSGCSPKSNGNIYTGYIEADITNISSLESSKVIEIFVKEGDFVKKGDILIKQDDYFNQLNLQKNESFLNIKKLALEKLLKGASYNDIEIVRSKMNSIESQTASIQADKDLLQKSFEDAQRLYSENVISENEYKNEKLALEKINKSLEVLDFQKKELNLTLSDILKGADSEDIKILEEEIKGTQYEIEKTKYLIDNTNIVAPINGYIRNVYYDVGELMTAGRLAVDMVSTENTYVQFYIEEKNLSSINLGQKILLKFDNSNMETSGTVSYISQTGQFTPKNLESKENRQEMVYRIKAVIEAKEGTKPGMMVDVVFGGE